jgi:phosphomannomutase
MIDHIGQEDYNYLLETLFANQLAISCQYKIPLTGTFFQYRDSMLNWCPVGRKAADAERSAWVKSDIKFKIRNHYMEQLNKVIKERNMCVTVALGGSTSFDIYPTGWDKTYVLKHLTLYDQIYFVGDKCKPGGNDHALYEKLKKINKHDSFETESPENTVEIIEELMRKN